MFRADGPSSVRRYPRAWNHAVLPLLAVKDPRAKSAIYHHLKLQLGLEGTFEVFNAACLQLGPTGSLHAKGNACWRAMEEPVGEVMGEEPVMEEVVTEEVVGAETVPEPEGRQSEQQSRDWLSLENGRRGDVRGGGVARQEMDRGGGCGSMSPDLLNGCWFASMCPIPLVWAIYHNQKVTDDRVRGEQASVGIARPPQRREPFPRRQRLRLLFWLPDPLR